MTVMQGQIELRSLNLPFPEKKCLSLNELVSIEFFPPRLALHIERNRRNKIPSLLDFEDAMRAVALIVRENEKIQSIEGCSDIVLKHPELVRRYGFNVNEAHCFLSREDFLKRWGA